MPCNKALYQNGNWHTNDLHFEMWPSDFRLNFKNKEIIKQIQFLY